MLDEELLRGLLEQARRAEPAVRSIALMRLARVRAKTDIKAARDMFETGLAEMQTLKGQDRRYLMRQARMLAASIFPEKLSQIEAAPAQPHHYESDTLMRAMVEHGHVVAALEYVKAEGGASFPFMMLPILMEKVKDESVKASLMRRAVESWREEQGDRMGEDHFYRLFEFRWRLLPDDEARAVAHQIVRLALERQDSAINASYGHEVFFRSMRENTLFRMLPILRRLDAELAESLIRDHAELAQAARRYPKGMESMHEEAERQRQQREKAGESCEGGFVMAGGPHSFGYMESLMQASRDGNFEPPMEHAQKQYLEDTAPENPNRAPKEFWSSTVRFRTILQHAGKRLGAEAAAFLERIPDDDLRLFAHIELAAAWAGLPELSSTEVRYGPQHLEGASSRLVSTRKRGVQGKPMQSPDGSLIRCPMCEWQPNDADRWPCKCGHVWNTFWTAGLCPACKYQWEITQCANCGEVSPHDDWYVRQ